MGLDLSSTQARPFPPPYPTWENQPRSTVQGFTRAYANWHQPPPAETGSPDLLTQLASRTTVGRIASDPGVERPLFSLPGLSHTWTTLGGLDTASATSLFARKAADVLRATPNSPDPGPSAATGTSFQEAATAYARVSNQGPSPLSLRPALDLLA